MYILMNRSVSTNINASLKLSVAVYKKHFQFLVWNFKGLFIVILNDKCTCVSHVEKETLHKCQ